VNVSKVTIPGDSSGAEYWAILSQLYVQNAMKNVKEMLHSEGGLKAQAKTPFMSGYPLELDVTNKLDAKLSSRYSQLLGILCWMVELGRVDIYHEVSVLSQYLTLPRAGHLEAVYHIFSYLIKHDKSSIIFDPVDPYFNPDDFREVDWSEFYGDVMEELPPKMPKPLGNPVNITCFVDANHAGNVVTHHLHTGILVYLQKNW
jgi:hypothetical protein